jgi:hypothetical protein
MGIEATWHIYSQHDRFTNLIAFSWKMIRWQLGSLLLIYIIIKYVAQIRIMNKNILRKRINYAGIVSVVLGLLLNEYLLAALFSTDVIPLLNHVLFLPSMHSASIKLISIFGGILVGIGLLLLLFSILLHSRMIRYCIMRTIACFKVILIGLSKNYSDKSDKYIQQVWVSFACLLGFFCTAFAGLWMGAGFQNEWTRQLFPLSVIITWFSFSFLTYYISKIQVRDLMT